MRLTSLLNKGLDWASSDEVSALQTRIKSIIVKNTSLTDVIQVMLVHWILPCQQRAFNLWEFDPTQHQTLNMLFNTTHEDAWKVLFKGAKVSPPTTEDRGFCAKRQASAVSCFTSYRILVFHSSTLCGI